VYTSGHLITSLLCPASVKDGAGEGCVCGCGPGPGHGVSGVGPVLPFPLRRKHKLRDKPGRGSSLQVPVRLGPHTWKQHNRRLSNQNFLTTTTPASPHNSQQSSERVCRSHRRPQRESSGPHRPLQALTLWGPGSVQVHREQSSLQLPPRLRG